MSERAAASAGPLRVLAVTNMYPSASAPSYGVFVKTQMESIESRGNPVEILFVDGSRGPREYLTAFGRVRREARSGRFDVVHAHFGLTGFVARRADLPLVISYCGDDLNGTVGPAGGTTLKSMVIVLLSQLAAFRADAIICKSDRLRDRLWRGKDRRRAHVIPNGVDLARFCPGDRSAARRELGLDPDERLVFFPHPRQEPVKRFDLAEAAIASLAASGMKARLWVPDKVPHARMPLHYQAADCLLLVSDREGSPNAVKEALCCDLPVVSVDVGDVPGWVSLAPGSQLVERTPESIASGIRQVLERGGRADGSEIRQRVGMDAIAEQVMTVYRNACARR